MDLTSGAILVLYVTLLVWVVVACRVPVQRYGWRLLQGVLASMLNRAWPARGMRRAIVLGVAASLLLVGPVACLEQADPLWIGGIWDDDDFDSVVAVVKSTEVLADSAEAVPLPLAPCLSVVLSPSVWRPIRSPVQWPENRAPPVL